MKIAVFGEDGFTGLVIDSLIEEGHDIQVIITPHYDTPIYLNLERVAVKHNILFIRKKDINSEMIIGQLKEFQPELIISVHLRKILCKSVFSIAEKGSINVHPSLLPKYRGMSPQHQALMHGDNESGVTVHFIDEDVDTGNIILQEIFSIAEDDYIVDVQLKVMEVYKTIVVRSVELIKNNLFKGYEQAATTSSYYGPIKKSDREIKLNKEAKDIYNLIRAVSMPYKGAFYNEFIIWTSYFPDFATEDSLKKTYTSSGVYMKNNELIIRSEDGVLISDNFDISP
jgi:methionyl-tRNA formyltransferase